MGFFKRLEEGFVEQGDKSLNLLESITEPVNKTLKTIFKENKSYLIEELVLKNPRVPRVYIEAAVNHGDFDSLISQKRTNAIFILPLHCLLFLGKLIFNPILASLNLMLAAPSYAIYKACSTSDTNSTAIPVTPVIPVIPVIPVTRPIAPSRAQIGIVVDTNDPRNHQSGFPIMQTGIPVAAPVDVNISRNHQSSSTMAQRGIAFAAPAPTGPIAYRQTGYIDSGTVMAGSGTIPGRR